MAVQSDSFSYFAILTYKLGPPYRQRHQPMKLWKWLVGLCFLLVLVDGALRKWVLPGQSAALFVLKDLVLWGSLTMYALTRNPLELPRPLRRTAIPLLLGAYVFVVMLQAFNPRQPNLTVSMIGLKAHLAFVPLIVLMPALVAEVTERQIVRFLWGYAVLVVLPLSALSVYQFNQPATAWVNQYVREMGTIAKAGEHVRVISTFSYVASHTVYLMFNAFLSAGVLFAGLRTGRRGLLTLGGLLLGTTAVVLPMTGSRGPIVFILVAWTVLLFIAESRYVSSLRFVGVAILVVIVVIQGTGLTEGWEALAERAEQANDTGNRIENLLSSPIEGGTRGGLLGYGAGSAHQAAPRFVPGSFTNDWLPDSYIESPMAREIIELGALGWFVLVALKTVLLYYAYRVVRRSQGVLGIIVGVTAFCMLLIKGPFPVTFNAVAAAFYWGTAGAMLGVWSRQEVDVRRKQKVAKTA
jgi:hypothetical protein